VVKNQYRCAKFIATRYLQYAGERNVKIYPPKNKIPMSAFLLTTQLICIAITFSCFFLSVKNPSVFLKYFLGFYSVVMALSLGPLFWNLGIYAVDGILINNMEVNAYQELFEHIRKVMFPAGWQPILMIMQLIPLAVMHRRATKAAASQKSI
jgi:hypothetical protein